MYMSVTSTCDRRFGTPWTVACPDSLSVTNSWSLCLLPSQLYCSLYFLFDEAVVQITFVESVSILAPLHQYTEAFSSGYLVLPALRKCVVHHSC